MFTFLKNLPIDQEQFLWDVQKQIFDLLLLYTSYGSLRWCYLLNMLVVAKCNSPSALQLVPQWASAFKVSLGQDFYGQVRMLSRVQNRDDLLSPASKSFTHPNPTTYSCQCVLLFVSVLYFLPFTSLHSDQKTNDKLKSGFGMFNFTFNSHTVESLTYV